MKAIDNKQLILALEELEKEKGIKKEYQGKLLDYTSENITIQTSEEKINIERKNISQIRTIYSW